MCVLIHPVYDLVVQYMNFGFACVGCLSLLTLPTNCSIAQYFLLYINVTFEGQFSSSISVQSQLIKLETSGGFGLFQLGF